MRNQTVNLPAPIGTTGMESCAAFRVTRGRAKPIDGY